MITTFYPPYHFGGDAMLVYWLSNALARRGIEVDVIFDLDAFYVLRSSPTAGEFPNEPGVHLHPLRSRWAGLSPLATQQTGLPYFKSKRIQAILEAHPPDVIHYHNISLVGGPGVLFLGDAIKLYTTHEHWLICPMHTLWKFGREPCEKRDCLACQIAGRRPPQWWRYTGLLERAMRQVDLFLSPSRFTINRHLEWGGLDIPMQCLPCFYGTPHTVPEEPEAPVHPRPYFLIVARLEKIKGVQNVIPAFRDHLDADLLIAGDGNYVGTLKELAGDNDQVRFLGQIDPNDLVNLYRGAIAVIVPSICYETFGLVLIEAFAHHTPVVVNDVGVLPEIVQDSRGGITYRSEEELKSALKRLLEDPEERRKVGEQGYEFYMRNYTEEVHLYRYLEIVENLKKERQKKNVR